MKRSTRRLYNTLWDVAMIFMLLVIGHAILPSPYPAVLGGLYVGWRAANRRKL